MRVKPSRRSRFSTACEKKNYSLNRMNVRETGNDATRYVRGTNTFWIFGPEMSKRFGVVYPRGSSGARIRVYCCCLFRFVNNFERLTLAENIINPEKSFPFRVFSNLHLDYWTNQHYQKSIRSVNTEKAPIIRSPQIKKSYLINSVELISWCGVI